MKQILMFSCPMIAAGFDLKLVISSLIIVTGSLIALAIWIADMTKLLSFSTSKRHFHRFFLWSFLVPGLNLLWIPWALIISGHLTRKMQERHVSQFLFNPGAGISILSVPLLILYLFWGTILLITHKTLLQKGNGADLVIYASTVIICFLIVFVSYLIYFSVFVHRLGILEKKFKTRQQPAK